MCQVDIQAPCAYGEDKGIVFDWDLDNKDGLCVCKRAICSVDGRNRVTAAFSQGGKNPYTVYASSPDCIVRPKDIHAIALSL